MRAHYTILHIYVYLEMAENEEPTSSTSQERCRSVSEMDSDITEKTVSLLDRVQCHIPLV